MKKIAITCMDGSVQIMTLIQGEFETALAKWEQQHPGKYVSHREIDPADLPADRTFRNAWIDDGTLRVNQRKAAEIHKDRLRRDRAPLLAALDVEYQRADETGDAKKKEEIVARKQKLRDITADPRLTSAVTPDDLKKITVE